MVLTSSTGFTSFRLLYWNKISPASITANPPLQTAYVSTLTAYAKNAGC